MFNILPVIGLRNRSVGVGSQGSMGVYLKKVKAPNVGLWANGEEFYIN